MIDADLDWLAGEGDLRIGELTRRLTRAFRERGVHAPEQDARALVQYALGLDLTGLVSRADDLLQPQARALLLGFTRRRVAFEPVGRILGSRDFRGLDMEVTEATLEPRDDTEVLVECALAHLAQAGIARPLIADLGTGTGAILIALLAARPDCLGVAVDLSERALSVARRNAVRHGVEARFLPIVGSYAAALRPVSYDLIVSNPPYIATVDIVGLDREVRDYDPHLALDGGSDGLDAYRDLIPQAVLALTSGGVLMVEIGASQGADVAGLMSAGQFRTLSIVADRAGRDRVVIARRS